MVSGRFLLEMRLGLCWAGGHLLVTRNSTQSYIQVCEQPQFYWKLYYLRLNLHFNLAVTTFTKYQNFLSEITSVSSDSSHPLYPMLSQAKASSLRLRRSTSQLPKINTKRFKSSFFNRLSFRYNLAL